MAKTRLTKQEVRNRNIPLPINRGIPAEYWEEDGQVFCERSSRYITQLLVCKLGYNDLTKHVCVYWDDVSTYAKTECKS